MSRARSTRPAATQRRARHRCTAHRRGHGSSARRGARLRGAIGELAWCARKSSSARPPRQRRARARAASASAPARFLGECTVGGDRERAPEPLRRALRIAEVLEVQRSPTRRARSARRDSSARARRRARTARRLRSTAVAARFAFASPSRSAALAGSSAAARSRGAGWLRARRRVVVGRLVVGVGVGAVASASTIRRDARRRRRRCRSTCGASIGSGRASSAATSAAIASSANHATTTTSRDRRVTIASFTADRRVRRAGRCRGRRRRTAAAAAGRTKPAPASARVDDRVARASSIARAGPARRRARTTVRARRRSSRRSFQALAQRRLREPQPAAHGLERRRDRLGDLWNRHPDREVKDQRLPLFGRQAIERRGELAPHLIRRALRRVALALRDILAPGWVSARSRRSVANVLRATMRSTHDSNRPSPRYVPSPRSTAISASCAMSSTRASPRTRYRTRLRTRGRSSRHSDSAATRSPVAAARSEDRVGSRAFERGHHVPTSIESAAARRAARPSRPREQAKHRRAVARSTACRASRSRCRCATASSGAPARRRPRP